MIKKQILINKIYCIAIFMFIILTFPDANSSPGSCSGAIFNPLTDICYECFFPITIGSSIGTSGDLPDPKNPGSPFCVCGGGFFPHFGIAVGFWQPTALIDVTRHRYCMVNLKGIGASNDKALKSGAISHESTNRHSFYYFHYIKLNVLDWFPIFRKGACSEGGIFPMYMSEVDPTWNDESLNKILYPEIQLLIAKKATLLAAKASQAAECLALFANQLPIDRLYWSAACHGSLYPMEGTVNGHVSSGQASTLISERAVLKLHRLGFMKDSDKNHLCGEKWKGYLPKSRYRYQMIYPANPDKCYPFGYSTIFWNNEISSKNKSEDFGFLIWKKRNCCAF